MSNADGSTHFEAPEPAELDRLLPSYEFQALIAKGGMGAVYKARQRSLDRDVAVKVLPRELGADPEFHKSFETEARAMARLNHSNLIAVYDSGSVDGMPFIVMEFVPGKSLYHSAYNKQLDPDEAVRLIRGILAGLGDAHEHGIVHRDIKPANILLTPKAEPKIGDFGLAVPHDADMPGLVMGTPGYTAPEVIANPFAADRRSDIFAVGVIFYELLTGQRPDDKPVPPSSLCDASKAYDAVFQRATHPNPAFRYPDCASMSNALAAAAKGAPAGGSPKLQVAAKPALATKAAAASATPAAAPDADADSATPAGTIPPGGPEAEIEIGSNWTLIRNLVIIAVLLVAIAFAWKMYKQKKKWIDAENRRIAAEQTQKRTEELRARELAKRESARREAARLKELEAKKITEQNAPPPETPLESLDRLRSDLVDGDRKEMPIDTARRGNFDFFLVTRPLGWREAAKFAEDHGGHLAIPRSDEDLSWLAERLGEDPAWIGAGRAQGKNWVILDGTPWNISTKPAGSGTFVALSDLGLVRGTPSGEQLPFFIQWHRDGSNPGTLDARLAQVRESIELPEPVFPPGTVSQEARRYLLVTRPASWTKACTIAERAGGHLAATSDLEEAIWLEDYLAKERISAGTWLAGTRKDDGTWSWDTGEQWVAERWADQQPGDKPTTTALLAKPDGSWSAADPTQDAGGFVIEWSNDHAGNEAEKSDIPEQPAGIEPLRVKAQELIRQAFADRDKALKANAKTFVWDLDVFLRGLRPDEQRVWRTHVEKLKLTVVDGRVPEQIVAADGIQLSERMAKIANFAARKQAETDDACSQKLARIRDGYIRLLNNQLVEAERAGRRVLARSLKKAIEDADVDADDLPDVFGIVD